MRILITFITMLTCLLLASCTQQPIPSDIPPTIGEIISRDAITNTSITNGSQALFNVQGGISIENKVFTFNEGTWKNEEESIPAGGTSTTSLTALYPAYSDDGTTFITRNPYASDTLQDVLIAQSTFTNETGIQLEFRHLFSRLTVHVHSSIANDIDAVTITAPKVAQIDPISGELEFSGQHITRFIKNGTGIYSCIVPAKPDCALTLTFTFDTGNEVSHPLIHTFVSGHKYECHVNRPGIRNAADLIEFSQFINDPNNKGKMHPEFGEKFGDSIVYRLLADIKLEPEDCEKLAPIGDHEDTPFYDTFDGEGHTISNLILPDENTLLYYSGLFGHIESTGIVNNLHITHATSIDSPTCRYVGVIAAYNGGIIDNCSVQNSRINSSSGYYIGLICGTMTGKIINCFTKNDTIDVSKNTWAGSIAGSSSGYIRNCYTYKNIFNMSSGSYAGCILGTSTDKARIENCYIYHSNTINRWGAAIGYSYNAIIKNFYYNRGTLASNTKYTESNTKKYDNNFCIEDTLIYNLLNQWIGEQSIYRHWTTDDNGSPCFE